MQKLLIKTTLAGGSKGGWKGIDMSKKNKKRSKKYNANKRTKSPMRTSLPVEKKDPLLNAHRNRSDNSIFDNSIFERYTSNEKYRTRFSEMYDQYYQTPVFKRVIDKLYAELKSYAGTIFPDYIGYRIHIYETYIKRRRDRFEVFSGFEFANPESEPLESDYEKSVELGAVMLLPLIFAHLEKELNNHTEDWKPTDDDLRDFNIWKLLFSILSQDLSFLLDNFMNEIDTEDIKYLDDDLDKLNSRALVQRFFEAVKKREKAVCYKILGRAQDLDPGESDYLEAVAHFYDQDYDTAIRYASRVKEDFADYGKAISLLLECYAAQGNSEELVECINANANLKYRPLQLIYLLQETILNLQEEPDEKWMKKSERVFSLIQKSEDIGEEYYGKLVKNAVECILKIYTEYHNASYYPDTNQLNQMINTRYFLSLCMIADIFEQAGIKELISKIEENEELISENWLDDFRAKAVDTIGKLTGAVGIIAIDNSQIQSLDLRLLALESMYKVDLISSFIFNVNNSINDLSTYYDETQDERVANIILLAYMEEAIRGNLNEKIKEYVESKLKDKVDDKSMSQMLVSKRLSKNAAIALESAETQYVLSKSIDWGWRDAGMLSLGYFRIVEVEVNQRLLLPVVNSVSIDRIRNDYDGVRNSLTGDDKKAYTSKWGRIVSTLEKIANGTADVDGLMLGEMEYFFRNIGSEMIEDDTLSHDIRGAISALLASETNLDEFISFMENDVVNKDIRDKYRNPPAHTKYLSYKTACECRDYFYQLMQQFYAVLK